MRNIATESVAKFIHDLSADPVDVGAWVEIIPSIEHSCSAIEIFSSANTVMKLSVGDVGNEDNEEVPYYVLPGGSSILLPLRLSRGRRLSAKSVGTLADFGSLVLNFFG
jgi:hypothetical protein